MIFGPVAQLGECYIRIVEVVGSTPIRSTKKKDTFRGVFCFLGWESKRKGLKNSFFGYII